MRRGIPYGESVLGVPSPTPEQLAADRGLIFVSYQASIVAQFETVLRRWANRPNLPRPGGHDPIIGQNARGGGRQRFVEFADGKRCILDAEWVIPTGGEYFFAPSVSAVRDVLGA
jgi:deferrochelatase/peroxidase EfeB